MGVHRGGALFRQALESVRPLARAFGGIVISINNLHPEEDLKTVTEVLDPDTRVILRTGENLGPASHFIWMVEKLKKIVPGSPPVMFLCHDDLLRADGIAGAAPGGAWNLGPDEVVLGDYAVFGDPLAERLLNPEGFASSFLGDLRDKECVTRREWFRHLEKIGYGFTSMSGIIVPLSAIVSAAAFLKLTRGHKGCRTEYLLASHHGVRTVRRYRIPIVAVRLHGGQESRHMAQPDLVTDEIRYCLWLLLNARSVVEFVWQVSGPQGVLAASLLFRQIVRLRKPESRLASLSVKLLILLAKAVHYPALALRRLIRVSF